MVFAAEVKRIVAEKPYLAEEAETVENEVQTEEIKYPHLYDEDKVSQEFIDAVNEDIETAIINIRKGNLDAVPEVIEVVDLEESSIKTLSDFLGYDISGYTVKIERDRLLHIERRHGINGEHDHSLSDPKDTARMGYVLNHGDDIDWVVDDNGNKVFDTQYNDKNNKPSPVIMISSKVDGTYCVSQAAPESKKKTLWITSARIQKADVGSQVPNSSTATPQLQTSETPLDSSSASNNSISNESEIVNSDDLTAEKTEAVMEEKADKDVAENSSEVKAEPIEAHEDKVVSEKEKNH